MIGPNIRELAHLARSAESLTCSAIVDVAGDRTGVAIGVSRDQPVSAHSWRGDGDDWSFSPITPPSFEQGMIDLADACPEGERKLDSITVRARKCSVRAPTLRRLVHMAWCEAFGVSVPAVETLQEQDRQEKAGFRQIHDEMLGDLRRGPAGVKKWNARSQKVRAKAGHFRSLDLSECDLAGITLSGLDFQQSIFDRADLRKARLKECDLRQAGFQGAKLDRADFTWAKLAGANFTNARMPSSKLWTVKNLRGACFQGADLSKARLVSSDLRGLSFHGANLSGADLSYCHMQGADLSEANLTDCKLTQARFDEQTRFPSGFTLPKGLTWAGKSPDPRARPVHQASRRPQR
jgi:uncharacterized protein YjbI with pentapeptide repeats